MLGMGGGSMFKLTEQEARSFEAICKGIGILALVFGGGWTLIQYFIHRSEERETARIEARKPFLEKRLQVRLPGAMMLMRCGRPNANSSF